MPGNEVGDRVHNFFEQDNLSQGQHHSQAVDGNWPVLSNNLWVGNQRQVGASLSSNPKNYSVQPSDHGRGHASQSLRVSHGLNFAQLGVRPEFSISQSQNHQTNLNGYMHGHQLFQARQNDGNFLGVDTESDRHYLTSRNLPTHESQQGNGSEHHKNTSRLESSESPVNLDFHGGQQQMSTQQPSMLQLPRQQSGFSDMQLLQQQVMFKQMQEFQRQQQLQQLEVRQQNSISQMSSIAKQSAGNLLNGTPIHDASNYSWSPELMAGNTNWLQRGASPAMPVSSNGLMFSPEQGQALRLMGLVPQQVDQSLYGVPISSTRGTPSQYSHMQIDKPPMQQIPAGSCAFPGNQLAVLQNQVVMQDGALVSRHGCQGKNLFENSPGQGLNSGIISDNSQQLSAHQSNASVQEFAGVQGLANSQGISQEKEVTQVAPSQSVATLDPTEEKILFGTDDNIWDAFGRSNTNLMGGSDFFNAFPSAQSGTWSALMQSAVAETASSDIGLQDEWSGVSFPNNVEPSTENHQPPSFNGSGKQHTGWTNNNFQMASSLSSRPSSDDVNVSANHGGIQHQQPELKFSHEQGERLQASAPPRSFHQSSDEGSKWVDRNLLQKPVAEGSRTYGNVVRSSDAELNVKSMSGPWIRQHGISSSNTSGQLSNKSNGWNFMESVSPSPDATLKIQENINLLQHSQNNDHKRPVDEDMGCSGAIWRDDSVLNSTVELGHAKPATGNSPVNRVDSSLNSVAAISNSSNLKVNQETCQNLPNSRLLDSWRHIDSSMRYKGGDSLDHMSSGPQVLGSSDKGPIEMREMEGNYDKKENSGESYRSNLPHHNSAGGLKENVCFDSSDSRTLPVAKQKSSAHVGRKASVSRKFQYHPMGNVDIDSEPSYGTAHVVHSQATSQQASRGLTNFDQGPLGQQQFVGHIPKNSIEMEKGHSPDFQGGRGSGEVPSRAVFAGYATNAPSPSDRSVGIYAPNKTGHSSQNMLDLLHKVDQSRECGNVTHLSNTSSEMPEAESSDGSVGHLQRNQSPASQGFGLQLAPPSQRLPASNRLLPSQNSSRAVNSLSSSQVPHDLGVKSHTWLASNASVQFLPREASQGELWNNKPGTPGQSQGKFSASFTSGFLRGQFQNQQTNSGSEQVKTNQAVNIPYDGFASGFKRVDDSHDRVLADQPAPASLPSTVGISHDKGILPAETPRLSITNQSHMGVSGQQNPTLEAFPVSQPSVTSEFPQQAAASTMLPNRWTSASSQQRLFGVQSHRDSSNLFKSHFQSNYNSKMMSSVHKVDDQDALKGRNGPSESGACSVNSQEGTYGEEQQSKESPWRQISSENMNWTQRTTSTSQGKESVLKSLSEASRLNPATSQREIEAFGRSLKPNNVFHQNYSLLHQVQSMKNVEIDPSNRGVKRIKGPEPGPEAQQGTPNAGQQLSYSYDAQVRDAPVNRSPVPSEDSKMLSFASEPGDDRDKTASSQLLLGAAHPRDVLAFALNDPQNHPSYNNTVSFSSVRAESVQISPQMAPSWFDQYGTFKNQQMSLIYDGRGNASVSAEDQQLIVGKPHDSLQTHNSVEHFSSAADGSFIVRQSSTPMSVGSENLSSSHSLPPDISDQSLVVLRPKKRKSATSGLIPWNKEVTLGSQRLGDISMAEMDWAQAANRLMEKVEDEAEMIEDGPAILRPKRRLILTTQLMQQLLRPPPAAVLSVDACSNYESVASFVTRLALGDACSLTSCSGNDNPVLLDSGNLISEKLKISDRIGDQYFSKVMEDLIGRTRKLEKDMLGLDKRASILDLRVECQDLEKFSVINRFARFHGRGQTEGAETSSSSDATASQKIFLQRYVTAHPMPRNLPDRVQCLSL